MPSKNYSMKSILRSLEVVSVPGLECPHGLQSLGLAEISVCEDEFSVTRPARTLS